MADRAADAVRLGEQAVESSVRDRSAQMAQSDRRRRASKRCGWNSRGVEINTSVHGLNGAGQVKVGEIGSWADLAAW
jgi:hypothetical protein